jgi:hypothetical protein
MDRFPDTGNHGITGTVVGPPPVRTLIARRNPDPQIRRSLPLDRPELIFINGHQLQLSRQPPAHNAILKRTIVRQE